MITSITVCCYCNSVLDSEYFLNVFVILQGPAERAQAAKNRGNKYFKGGVYDKAIECYTEAIDICPADHRDDIATFYQNRAAAYEQLVSIM